ncbi:sensor histidine kinase [Rothia sp. L_38]|uniref:sensor histidine kinase n=1 Tax=Rothia sp. L_38 TaxID=3422315 RepID=UPI003D6B795D
MESRKLSSTSGNQSLRPRARLLKTLGSELISSDKVAVIELVKNSYDADASTVVIRFKGPLCQGKGSIEVWDNGHGMNVDSIQNSWLDIATDIKRKHSKSEKGRRVLGEKGIGRLAAARLGNQLTLITRSSLEDEINLSIDWSQFDRDNAYLDEIEISWESNSPKIFNGLYNTELNMHASEIGMNNPSHGTLIKIDELNHTWTDKDFIELRTALSRLIRPNAESSNLFSETVEEDFKILLLIDDNNSNFEKFSGEIGFSNDFQIPNYKITGFVGSDGRSEINYFNQQTNESELIKEPFISEFSDRSPEVGPFSFEINVWDRDKVSIEENLRISNPGRVSPKVNDLKGFRDTLNDLAGVSIYRDGFRVLPFGEPGDDWLGLDLRRVQNPSMRLSNNQIIGRVMISADLNPGLKDQSNREGLISSGAYDDLQKILLIALNELEQRRFKYRRDNTVKSEKEKGGLFKKFDLSEVRGTFAKNYPHDIKLISLIDKKNKDIEAGVAEVQQVISRYSRLATLGSLIDRVIHDGRTAVTFINQSSRFGENKLKSSKLKDLQEISSAINHFQNVNKQSKILSSLFNQIEPFGGRKRGRPRKIDVAEAIKKSISNLQTTADDFGVLLESDYCSHTTFLDESEIMVVLTNLISNAIYWTAKNQKETERKVFISSRVNDDSSITFIVSDTGPGVPAENRENIFDPYFSTKPDGVGLGLSIVGNIVEDIYSGELALVDDSQYPGATFEATFRRRV